MLTCATLLGRESWAVDDFRWAAFSRKRAMLFHVKHSAEVDLGARPATLPAADAERHLLGKALSVNHKTCCAAQGGFRQGLQVGQHRGGQKRL